MKLSKLISRLIDIQNDKGNCIVTTMQEVESEGYDGSIDTIQYESEVMDIAFSNQNGGRVIIIGQEIE